MSEKKLSFSSYLFIGSMLFGMFFGAGNLIFPVQMGQEAGANVWPATLGFVITGVGLPFLGVVAIGLSRSNGLYDLASRVHPIYGLLMTIALYLTIGPLFALPRTGTLSYEIGLSSYIGSEHQTLGLAIFTGLFFLLVLALSIKPSKILMWVGKVLNPLFLLFLALLIVAAIFNPMGGLGEVHGSYTTEAFSKGFLEGYNTMDALASLAFGIVVVQAIKDLGVTKPREIAMSTVKAGTVSLILMVAIYGSLALIGATSVHQLGLSLNGGLALANVAQHYFGPFGGILLAIIITLACMKTAVGLVTACSETFHQIFPKISYRTFAIFFSVFAGFVANVGLTNIIKFAVPVLMFLYPLAITLIILALLSPAFKHRQVVYVVTTIFTFFVSVIDGLVAVPGSLEHVPFVKAVYDFYYQYLPLYPKGMGWICPALAGLIVGCIIARLTKPKKNFDMI